MSSEALRRTQKLAPGRGALDVERLARDLELDGLTLELELAALLEALCEHGQVSERVSEEIADVGHTAGGGAWSNAILLELAAARRRTRRPALPVLEGQAWWLPFVDVLLTAAGLESDSARLSSDAKRQARDEATARLGTWAPRFEELSTRLSPRMLATGVRDLCRQIVDGKQRAVIINAIACAPPLRDPRLARVGVTVPGRSLAVLESPLPAAEVES